MTEIRFTPDGISSSFQVNVTSSNFAIGSSDNVSSEFQLVNLLENTAAFDKIVVIDDFDRVFYTNNLILDHISASSADINNITSSFISASGFISASTLYVENSAFFENGLTGSISGSTAIFNNITSSVISASYIDLDPLVNGDVPPHKEGRIYFNTEEGALTVYNNEADISLQIGQEFYIRVRNETGNVIENGVPVKISGSQGDTPFIHLAVAEDVTQFYANPDSRELFQNHIIGLTTHRIEHNTVGYVTELGIVRGLDTTQFQAGDEIYVSSSAGEITNIPPEFPYEIIQVGTVVRSASNGFIFVNTKEPVSFGNISGFSGSYDAHLGDLWVYQENGAWTHTRYVPQLTSSIISASNFYATNIFDINSESGSSGQILSSTPTGIDWVDISGISGSVIGSGTTNYLSKWKTASELTRSVVYEDTNGNIGIGTTSPTHVIEVSGSNQNLLNLNDVLYVSGSHLNGVGSALVNVGTDKDLDATLNIGKNISANLGSSILNINSYYSPEIHLVAHGSWSDWTIEGGVNKDLKIYDQGTNRRDSVSIGTTIYPTTLVMTKTDPCFEVEIAGGNQRSLSIGQTFVGSTQRYDTHLRTSNGNTTYESFLFKHTGEIVASGSFIGSDVNVSGSTSKFHGDVKITGSLYLTGSLYDVNENVGNGQNILSSTGDSIQWINYTDISGSISGSGTANYLSKWKSSSELTRSVIYEDVNGNIGIGTTSPSELFNIVGNSLLEGDLTVTGQSIFLSASYINLTSSNVNIGDNILTLNAFSPFKRYAGIEMNDSGSDAVAQFLWDSELDYFFISGSTATNSQNLVIVGPDSNESLSTGYLTLATDINQLSSSVISQNNDGNIGIGITNPTHSLNVVGGIKTDQLYDKNNASGSDGQILSSTPTGIDWINATDIDGFVSGSGTTNYVPIWKSSSELSSSNIYQLNGNVSIGTNNPRGPFEVYATSDATLVIERYTSNGIQLRADNSVNSPIRLGMEAYLYDFKNGSGTSRLYIDSSGDVGIGTTSPNQKLTVAGNISASGDLYLDGGIYDTNNSKGTSGQLLSSTGTATDWIDATDIDGFISGSGTTNYVPIWKSSSELSSSTIYQLNGNVGIGTPSPVTPLHVSSTADNIARFSGFGSAGTYIKLDEAGTQAWVIGLDNSSTTLRIREDDTTGDAWVSILANSGNVGIATTNPAAQLHVSSSVAGTAAIFESSQDYQIRVKGNATWAGIQFCDNSNNDIIYFYGATKTFSIGGAGSAVGGKKLHVDGGTSIGNGYDNLTVPTNGLTVSGSVGIGTTSPSAKVHIRTQTGTDTAGGSDSHIRFDVADDGGPAWAMRLGDTVTDGDFHIDRRIGGTWCNTMTLERNTGNVGIGTTNPTRELEIMGSGNVYTRISSSISNDTALELYSGCNYWSIVNEGTTSSDLKFRYQGLTKVTISSSNGNVGIGTTSPEGNLHIFSGGAGTVTASTAANELVIEGSGDAGLNILSPDNKESNIFLGGPGLSYGGLLRWKHSDLQLTLGTNVSNAFIAFNTDSGTERMRIAADGNVGIGTTSPNYKLHTVGGAGVFDVSSAAQLNHHLAVTEVATLPDWRPYAGTTTAALQLQSSATRGILLAAKSTGNQDFYNTDGLDIYVSSSMGSTSAQRGNLAMSISSSGNVGIGVASPSNKLEVQQLASDQSGAAAIKVIGTAYGTNKTIHACMGTTSNTKSLFYAENSNGVIMNIAGDGNVGIGTANPSEKLHVNGLTQLGAAGKTEGGAIITYASFSEIKNAAATLIGNAVVPGTANNTIQHSKTDAGNYIKLKYNQGITFHTNITNSIDTDISEDTNESVRIDLNGNVGIGTSSPTQKLHVSGSIRIQDGGIYDTNNEIGISGQLLSSTGTATDWIDATEIDGFISGSGTTNYIPIWKSSSELSSSNIYQLNNNVGIGTPSPIAKFEVTDGSSSITLQEYSSGAAIFLDGVDGDFAGGDYFHILANSNFYLGLGGYAGGATPLNIDNSGNVGIGTTSPDALLELSSSTAQSLLNINKGDLYVSSSGYVGIGTTDPTSLLHIDTAANSAANFKLGANRTVANAAVGQLVGDWNGTVVAKIALKTGDDTTNKDDGEIAFEVAAAGSTAEAMRIDSSGKVGMGTTDPASVSQSPKLAVVHNGAGIATFDATGAGGGYITITDSNTPLAYLGSSFQLISSNGAITDTALRSQGELVFATGGSSERVRIDSDGNVGICTTIPNNNLVVGDGVQSSSAPAVAGEYIEIARTSGGDAGFLINKNTGQWLFGIDNSDGTNPPLRFEYSAAGAAHAGFGNATLGLALKYDGNVGIGTTNPNEKLTVEGNISGSGGLVLKAGEFSGFSNTFHVSNGYNPNVSKDSIAVISVTDNATFSNGIAALHVINNGNRGNKGNSDGSDLLRLEFNDSIHTIFDKYGNVGIGTTNPTHSLNVVGGIKTDQIYDKNNVSGSDGQILSSTTTGIDWVDATDIDGFVSGSGTATYLPLWTDTNTLSSSIVFQQADGNVGVNTTTPAYELEVSGGFAATEKHFVVQDPTNPKKRLVHSSLEGPENAVYFRGISNKKVIELPEYWRWLVNSDTITVHLTPVKKYQKLYFSKYEDNKIYINNSLVDKLKFNKLNYHYIIYAERKDVNKLKVYVTK